MRPRQYIEITGSGMPEDTHVWLVDEDELVGGDPRRTQLKYITGCKLEIDVSRDPPTSSLTLHTQAFILNLERVPLDQIEMAPDEARALDFLLHDVGIGRRGRPPDPSREQRAHPVLAVAATSSSILDDAILQELARRHTALATALNILKEDLHPSWSIAQERLRIGQDLAAIERAFARRAQVVVDSMLETAP